MKRLLALFCLVILNISSSQAATNTIGTFSSARLHIFARTTLFAGDLIDDARAALIVDGHTLQNLDAGITADALVTVDILYLNEAFEGPSVLTETEANVVAAWVNAGGTMIVQADMTFGTYYNNLAAKFNNVQYLGLSENTGLDPAYAITTPYPRLTNGPHGEVSTVLVNRTGAVDPGTSSGLSLRDNSLGSFLYVLAPDTGFSGSGTAIFLTDINTFDDPDNQNGFATADGADLWRNMFSLETSAPVTYSVSGTVSGLTDSVTLQNNGGDDIIKDAFDNSGFTFPAQAEGSSYSVSVSSQPFGQTCTVTDGSGTIGTANITNVTVTCEDTRLLGGFMIGVASGGSITLQNNGVDDFTWLENPITSYRFPTRVPVGATWNVTVLTPPTGQTCTVRNAVGTMGNSNFTDVDVTCTDAPTPTYSIGGVVSGLTGSGLALQNNGEDTLPVAAAATGFIFVIELADSATYAVTVSTQPTGQTCGVTGGDNSLGGGSIAGADVTSVVVTCVSAKADQTITDFTATSSGGVVGGSSTLSATASSGLTVTFGSDTPTVCMVTGSTVSYLLVGACTVTAGQAGDADYNPTPQLTLDINVTEPPLAIPNVSIPTLSLWGLVTMFLILLGIGGMIVRRKTPG